MNLNEEKSFGCSYPKAWCRNHKPSQDGECTANSRVGAYRSFTKTGNAECQPIRQFPLMYKMTVSVDDELAVASTIPQKRRRTIQKIVNPLLSSVTCVNDLNPLRFFCNLSR